MSAAMQTHSLAAMQTQSRCTHAQTEGPWRERERRETEREAEGRCTSVAVFAATVAAYTATVSDGRCIFSDGRNRKRFVQYGMRDAIRE